MKRLDTWFSYLPNKQTFDSLFLIPERARQIGHILTSAYPLSDMNMISRMKGQLSLKPVYILKEKVQLGGLRILDLSKNCGKLVGSKLKLIAEKINSYIVWIAQTFGNYAGFIVGPALSLAGATVVRLSLGKRVPTSGPLYLSALSALTLFVTVWAIQFFKNPKYKKIIDNKGVAQALSAALPLSRTKIIEPMHSRHFLSYGSIEGFLNKFEAYTPHQVKEPEAKNSFVVFKQYIEWVKKKIKLERANGDTLKILKDTLSQYFMKVLKNLILHGDRVLIEEFLQFNSKDAVVNKVLSKEDLADIYFHFGYRLALITKKNDLLGLFPETGRYDPTLAVMDATLAAHTDKIVDITSTSIIDPYKMIEYGQKGDLLLNMLNYELPAINLVQLCTLYGDVEGLKRVIASSQTECDWSMRNSKGVSLLSFAALSGQKPMWDFVKQLVSKMPRIEDSEYLHLLYSAVKSGSLEIFVDLFDAILADEFKDLSGALVLDLYEKAVSYGSSKIMRYIEIHSEIHKELSKPTTTNSMLKAAILGSNEALFKRFFEIWKPNSFDRAVDVKEMLETVCSAKIPNDALLTLIRQFEDSFSSTYVKLEIDLTSLLAANASKHFSEDSLLFMISRLSKDQLLRFMAERGEFFNQMIIKTRALEAIIDKCSDAKFLLTGCAKEAIKSCQLDTLRMLCRKGVDCIKKMPDSSESLLSYSVLSLNPDLVDVILGTCPPLSALQIMELKARVTELKCHKEDEAPSAHICRMLDAKSLERGSAEAVDPQLLLALTKAEAMDFAPDTAGSLHKEDTSRGLLAMGLGYLGLL